MLKNYLSFTTFTQISWVLFLAQSSNPVPDFPTSNNLEQSHCLSHLYFIFFTAGVTI